MRKIILLLLTALMIIPAVSSQAEASLISDRSYRAEQKREFKQNVKQIEELFKIHNQYANAHDLKKLRPLYLDSYMNSDGFNKEVYFKSIESTWESCEDLTYTTDIVSVDINGNYARVQVEETATGTIMDTLDFIERSSLKYGDARFMNIELQAPAQVSAGETYTTTLKVDADPSTFILGSIDHDVMTYPSSTPKNELRALPQSQTLERLIKANTQNLNEYTVASLAISRVKLLDKNNFRIYMAGLACVMKRVNVIPKNNYVEIKEEKNESKL